MYEFYASTCRQGGFRLAWSDLFLASMWVTQWSTDNPTLTGISCKSLFINTKNAMHPKQTPEEPIVFFLASAQSLGLQGTNGIDRPMDRLGGRGSVKQETS